jgi:hypothetical protein
MNDPMVMIEKLDAGDPQIKPSVLRSSAGRLIGYRPTSETPAAGSTGLWSSAGQGEPFSHVFTEPRRNVDSN